jgi:hypothetical protein
MTKKEIAAKAARNREIQSRMSAIYLQMEKEKREEYTAEEKREMAELKQELEENHREIMLSKDEARAYQYQYAMDVLRRSATKAAAVLVKQLDSDNAWIVQQAATKILQYVQTMEQTQEAQITINFGSMPRPGLPNQTDDVVEVV